MVAHSAVNRVVRGSSPLTGARIEKADLRSRVGFFYWGFLKIMGEINAGVLVGFRVPLQTMPIRHLFVTNHFSFAK